MQIRRNEKGFITDYALIGNLVDGIDIPTPTDIEHFEKNFKAYTLANGVLKFDSHEAADLTEKEEVSDLRNRREKECFSFINRGQLWYATLTVKQLAELTAWYRAWLKVTETKTIPEKPEWLE